LRSEKGPTVQLAEVGLEEFPVALIVAKDACPSPARDSSPADEDSPEPKRNPCRTRSTFMP
jgi:hypothetical protein